MRGWGWWSATTKRVRLSGKSLHGGRLRSRRQIHSTLLIMAPGKEGDVEYCRSISRSQDRLQLRRSILDMDGPSLGSRAGCTNGAEADDLLSGSFGRK